MKNKQKPRFQQKLNHYESIYELSEYSIEHLVTPTHGPLVTNDMYAELNSLEFFSNKKLKEFRNRLTKSMSKYPADYDQIEMGLASYVNSASQHTRPLAILVKSILCTFENILFENYEEADFTDTQFINLDYFQNTDWVDDFELKDEDLINSNALKLYVRRANEITISAMKEWFRFTLKKEERSA